MTKETFEKQKAIIEEYNTIADCMSGVGFEVEDGKILIINPSYDSDVFHTEDLDGENLGIFEKRFPDMVSRAIAVYPEYKEIFKEWIDRVHNTMAVMEENCIQIDFNVDYNKTDIVIFTQYWDSCDDAEMTEEYIPVEMFLNDDTIKDYQAVKNYGMRSIPVPSCLGCPFNSQYFDINEKLACKYNAFLDLGDDTPENREYLSKYFLARCPLYKA